MKEEIIYTTKSTYREPMEVKGYRFGNGKPSVAIVGAVRGNEIAQLYACSQLMKALVKLERDGNIPDGHEMLIIPSVNSYSMNVSKRFWTTDNTDINRMFPGDKQGETTQRIAAGVFEAIKGYEFGIQFASFYMKGDFIPHIRMMRTGYERSGIARLFGLPYTLIRNPKPYDTTTLNYNWQSFETHAFSVFTSTTDSIHESSISLAKDAVLRFLSQMGIIKCKISGGYLSELIRDDMIASVRSKAGGLFRAVRQAGDAVDKGDVLCEILDPMTGEALHAVTSPVDGVIFFSFNQLLVSSDAVIYKIIPY